MQIVLGYVLSRFLINTRRKSKEFLKTEIILRGYIQVSIRHDFITKARRVCWSGSIIVAIVLAIPLYCSLLVPHLFEEIYFSIQLIVFVYIGINIAETLRVFIF